MYSLKAIITGVRNKERPYYNSCKICTKSVSKSGNENDEAYCEKCKKTTKSVPRYCKKKNHILLSTTINYFYIHIVITFF